MELDKVVTPLQQLILEHLAVTGESYNDLAKRGGLPRQTLQALVHRESQTMPRRSTLEGVARALDLPLQKVQQAAATSAAMTSVDGVHPQLGEGDPLTVLLVRTAGDLSPEHRQVLLATARAMKKAELGQNGYQTT